jgi:hypothetical protein
LEVNKQLEELEGGIVKRMEIKWIFKYKRGKVFEVIVKEEVIKAS